MCECFIIMTEKQLKALNYLKGLPEHLYRMDYKDICIDLDSYISHLPISIFSTDKISRFEETSPRDKSIIYRARENEVYIPERSSHKLPFKNLREISMIPDEKKEIIKQFGRCNKPLQPRFYASNNYPTACMEALTNGFTQGVSESKFVTIGSWKIIEPLVLSQINYSKKSLEQFLEYDMERYKKMVKYAEEFDNHNLKQMEDGKYDDSEYQHELYKYFADEFARIDINGDDDYKIINYYCDHIFDRLTLEDGNTKVDGVLYPSVSFSYQEMNLVLHPRAMSKI